MFRNTVKTVALLAGLGGFFVLVGGLIGGSTGVVIGGALGLALVGASYWFSDRIAIRAAGARPLEPGEADWLAQMTAELSARAGIRTPRLYLSPSPQPNAFATGRNERTAIVAVTDGLLASLDRSEVGGVVAHELAHIRNRDILIGSIAAAIATGISVIANMALFAGIFGGGDDDDAPSPVAMLAIALLAPIAATILQMALSRSREFEADRVGARILGDPRPLARALQKLEAGAARTPMEVTPAQSTAYIVNPLRGGRGTARFARLFLTHPPTEERVEKLLGRSAAAGV